VAPYIPGMNAEVLRRWGIIGPSEMSGLQMKKGFTGKERAKIRELSAHLRELLGLTGGNDPSHDDSHQGRLLKLATEVLEDLGRHTCALIEAAEDFAPRVLVCFRDEAQDSVVTGITGGGDTRLLENGLESLKEEMDELMSEHAQHNERMAIWLSPVHLTPEITSAIAYVRFGEGFDALYLLREDEFTRIPADEGLRKSLIATTLKRKKNLFEFTQKYFLPVYQDILKSKETIESSASEGNLVFDLTEEHWFYLIGSVLMHPATLQAIAHMYRDVRGPLIGESASLAMHLAEFAAAMMHRERDLLERIEAAKVAAKDSVVKKLQSELNVAEMMAKGAVARAQRVEEELAALKKSKSSKPGEPQSGSAGNNVVPLSVRLEALFTPMEQALS
ncbi:hypothetical protein LC612_39665, partial [Nostoc sp. CHAB 5834]|nr:hypothetical protein [Nostoc sp. CHAB 5834]